MTPVILNMLGEELFIQDIYNNGAVNEATSLKWWKQSVTCQLFTGFLCKPRLLSLFAQNEQINQVLKKTRTIYVLHYELKITV